MNQRAFTMIEILLVVVIISILAAMVVPNLTGRSDQARVVAAQTDVDSIISAALDLYKMDNGSFPTSEQGLAALVVQPTAAPVPAHWNGPYLKNKKIPQDPWGRPYVYLAPGSHNKESYDLYSLGQDGVESKDDIINWEKEK